MPTVMNPNAADDEPLHIKLEDDEPAPAAAAEPAAPPPAAPAAPAPTPAAGVEDLKRQLAESKRNREVAAQAAQRAAAERDQALAIAAEAQRRGVSADEVVVDTRLAAAQQEMEALTEAQTAAFEAGDWKKVAELNAKMNRAGGSLAFLEAQRTALQGQRAQFEAHQQQLANQQAARQAAPPRPSDPIEAYIGTRSAPSQQFMRQHRAKIFRPDGSIKRVAIDAHEAALDAGHAIDTPDYFRHLETALGGGGGQPQGGERVRAVKDTAAQRPQGAPTVAAPVSRETLGRGGGSEYVMTPRMRELAREQMGSDSTEAAVEWFKSYQKAVREGRMEPLE